MKCPDCNSLINDDKQAEDYRFCYNCGGRVIQGLGDPHLITNAWWSSLLFTKLIKNLKSDNDTIVKQDISYEDLKYHIEFGYLI